MVKHKDPHDREAELLVWLNSRTVALMLYGMMGFEVGLTTLLTGGPPLTDSVEWGVIAKIVIGLTSLIGGLLTIAGSLLGDRSRSGWAAALLGTSLMALWAFGVGTAYAVGTLQLGVVFSWPWHSTPESLGRLYIPMLYQSILLLILLHVVTLIRLGRPPR